MLQKELPHRVIFNEHEQVEGYYRAWALLVVHSLICRLRINPKNVLVKLLKYYNNKLLYCTYHTSILWGLF